MLTFIETPVYTSGKIIDVNYVKLQKYNYPLVIVAREGQKKRMQDNLSNFDFVPLGWWELKDLYLHPYTQKPIDTMFKQHEAVFFIDPCRADSRVVGAYKSLVSYVQLIE